MSGRPAIHVGFSVTALTHGMAAGGVDGIGSYTRELLSRLGTRSDIRLTKYAHGLPIGLDNAFADTFDGGHYQLQALPALIAGRSFPRMRRLRKTGVELVHATDHLVPRVRGLPVVATLMDAIPLSHPEWVAYRFKGVMNELWRRSLHWADRVLTISEHSAAR